MSITRYLIQKIRHPRRNEWIETMYYQEDSENPDNPSIHWHGKLADEKVVSPYNLENGMVTGIEIDENDNENLIISIRD